jgi:hypothetical protein
MMPLAAQAVERAASRSPTVSRAAICSIRKHNGLDWFASLGPVGAGRGDDLLGLPYASIIVAGTKYRSTEVLGVDFQNCWLIDATTAGSLPATARFRAPTAFSIPQLRANDVAARRSAGLRFPHC